MTFSQIWNNGFLSNIVFPSQGSLISVTLVSGLAVSVLSYLLGSINPAIIVSKKFYGDDIRTHGSGNAGMTNVMRTYGKKMAIITFLGDFLKAVVASLLGRAFLGVFGAYMAGFFCFLGHLYPCFYNFKGGKGVVTTAAMIVMTDWRVFLILFAIFVIVVAATKYISLGSVIGIMFYPIVLDRMRSLFGIDNRLRIVIIFVLGIMLLTLWKHRENLKRITKGQENKFTFKVKDKKTVSEEKSDTDNTSEEEK